MRAMRELTTREAFARLRTALRDFAMTALEEGILKFAFWLWLTIVVWFCITMLAGCGD
jgi:hypothetical protein